MTNLGEILAGPLAGAGFGGAAGAIVGYTAKKLTKLAALLLGVFFILIQLLVHLGWITVDWGAVEAAGKTAWTDPSGTTVADRALAVLTANLPFAGGFLTGFALGFKVG